MQLAQKNHKVIKLFVSCFSILILLNACKKQEKQQPEIVPVKPVLKIDTDSIKKIPEVKKRVLKILDTVSNDSFIRLKDYSDDFDYDLRYATENNFLNKKVYECAECYMRAETAKKIIKANKYFLKQGVKISFFDCYRPNSVQYKMWEIMPNPQYVANPKKGSVHNRGGAVDITLVTLNGESLDMGTDFDFFGWKGYHDNFNFDDKILKNRKLLKETMEEFGFKSVRSEWWHYNMIGAYKYKVANFNWKCN